MRYVNLICLYVCLCSVQFDCVQSVWQRHSDENLRLSILGLYMNYSLIFSENSSHYETGKVQLLSQIADLLSQSSSLSSTIIYRLCVILGTLLYEDDKLKEIAVDLDVRIDTVSP